MKNKRNKRRNLLIKIVCIFLILISAILVFDYFNILNFISKNLNFDFLNIIMNVIVVIFIFLLTYILIEQKSFEIQDDVYQKKIKVLVSLLLRIYYKCIENIDLLENQEILEKYIIPKCDFNAINDSFMNDYKDYPFDFENRVIDLMQTGIVDVVFLDNYLDIKNLYRKYVNIRIAFFDIKKSNINEHKEVVNLIDIDQFDLKRKLECEINKLLEIKKKF